MKLKMFSKSFLFMSLLVGTMVPRYTSAESQSVYLKEMMMGRCYFEPPTGEAKDSALCNSIVGSILSVTESRLDKTITVDDYSRYFEMADFTPSTTDNAVFWPPSGTSGDNNPTLLGSISRSTSNSPEGTPGGSLLNGLVFCGTDQRQDCPSDLSSGASTAFWTGAYEKFATAVQGSSIQIILEDDATLDPLLEGAIPNLDSAAITSVVVFSFSSCKSKGVKLITSALIHDAGIDSDAVVCTTDELHMNMILYCNDTDGDDPSSSVMCACMAEQEAQLPPPEEEDDDTVDVDGIDSVDEVIPDINPNNNEDGGVYKTLFWLLVIVGGGYWVYTNRQQLMNGYQTIPSSEDYQPKQ